jgi:hypothetical protein
MSYGPPVDIARYITEAGLLLKDKANWCQGCEALDRRGNEIKPTSVRAVQWDAIGAICKAANCDFTKNNPNNFNEASAALAAAHSTANLLHKRSLERVNDDLGHDDVLEVLRITIRRNRSREAT